MKKGCLIAGSVPLILFGGIAFLVWDFVEIKDWGVGEDSVDWLPRQASNITYIYSRAIQLAEFDIDQKSFEEWCRSIEKPLKPMTEGQEIAIQRANNVLAMRGAIEKPTAKNNSAYRGNYDWHFIRFTGGDLFYNVTWPNGGGYSIGYDVNEGRGYYNYSHH